MRILFALGHPAHFHLVKNIIVQLQIKGHSIKVVISDKDILIKLLHNYNIAFDLITQRKGKETIFSKSKKILNSTFILKKIVKSFRPDLMLGSLTQPAYLSTKKHPYIFLGEDDITYTYLQCFVTYPFVKKILAPAPTKTGLFARKKISYQGYQKLAYLHPNVFIPNPDIIKNCDSQRPIYLIRLVNLNAYHDISAKGLTNEVLKKTIEILEQKGNVYISSENQLPDELKKYIPPVSVSDLHHLLAFSSLYIGDSQSMAVEAAMLGVPSIRYNSFAGRISVLEELEHNYGLTFGIKDTQPDKLFSTINSLLSINNLRDEFQKRRQKMLSEKIDVSAFMVWLIENYPHSAKIMKENPDYQYNFK